MGIKLHLILPLIYTLLSLLPVVITSKVIGQVWPPGRYQLIIWDQGRIDPLFKDNEWCMGQVFVTGISENNPSKDIINLFTNQSLEFLDGRLQSCFNRFGTVDTNEDGHFGTFTMYKNGQMEGEQCGNDLDKFNMYMFPTDKRGKFLQSAIGNGDYPVQMVRPRKPNAINQNLGNHSFLRGTFMDRLKAKCITNNDVIASSGPLRLLYHENRSDWNKIMNEMFDNWQKGGSKTTPEQVFLLPAYVRYLYNKIAQDQAQRVAAGRDRGTGDYGSSDRVAGDRSRDRSSDRNRERIAGDRIGNRIDNDECFADDRGDDGDLQLLKVLRKGLQRVRGAHKLHTRSQFGIHTMRVVVQLCLIEKSRMAQAFRAELLLWSDLCVHVHQQLAQLDRAQVLLDTLHRWLDGEPWLDDQWYMAQLLTQFMANLTKELSVNGPEALPDQRILALLDQIGLILGMALDKARRSEPHTEVQGYGIVAEKSNKLKEPERSSNLGGSERTNNAKESETSNHLMKQETSNNLKAPPETPIKSKKIKNSKSLKSKSKEPDVTVNLNEIEEPEKSNNLKESVERPIKNKSEKSMHKKSKAKMPVASNNMNEAETSNNAKDPSSSKKLKEPEIYNNKSKTYERLNKSNENEKSNKLKELEATDKPNKLYDLMKSLGKSQKTKESEKFDKPNNEKSIKVETSDTPKELEKFIPELENCDKSKGPEKSMKLKEINDSDDSEFEKSKILDQHYVPDFSGIEGSLVQFCSVRHVLTKKLTCQRSNGWSKICAEITSQMWYQWFRAKGLFPRDQKYRYSVPLVNSSMHIDTDMLLRGLNDLVVKAELQRGDSSDTDFAQYEISNDDRSLLISAGNVIDRALQSDPVLALTILYRNGISDLVADICNFFNDLARHNQAWCGICALVPWDKWLYLDAFIDIWAVKYMQGRADQLRQLIREFDQKNSDGKPSRSGMAHMEVVNQTSLNQIGAIILKKAFWDRNFYKKLMGDSMKELIDHFCAVRSAQFTNWNTLCDYNVIDRWLIDGQQIDQNTKEKITNLFIRLVFNAIRNEMDDLYQPITISDRDLLDGIGTLAGECYAEKYVEFVTLVNSSMTRFCQHFDKELFPAWVNVCRRMKKI